MAVALGEAYSEVLEVILHQFFYMGLLGGIVAYPEYFAMRHRLGNRAYPIV